MAPSGPRIFLRVKNVRNVISADTAHRGQQAEVASARLTAAQKKRLIGKLAHLRPSEIATARVELAPAVELDVGRLVGDVMDRAERYRLNRDAFITVDAAIKGGTPVIRGTRMTVYSVLRRIENGETVDDVPGDNPDLSREAVEAAITFARTRLLMGRPGGRPWARAE